MGNPVVHFAINGQDPAVLHGFYRKAFGWTVDADNPMAYGFVRTGSDQGIQGGIATGNGGRGVVVYLETDDVQGTLDRAVAAGAEVVMAPETLPGVVELAQVRDPEGNVIGVSRNLARTAPAETATNITQVGTVIVPVSDQDRALEFYLGKLGFEKRMDASFGAGERWVEVAPPGAATTIALVPRREGDPTGTEVSFTTRDAEADHATLRARGVDADAALIRMGDQVPPMFTFRDPDGNRFRMVERG
jgi:predicted enzyme related to lactoylglutathione lyase